MATIHTESLKTRMADIFAEAREQGLNFSDIIPPELQDYWYGSTASQTAQDYILELEEKAKAEKEENSKLRTQLMEAEQTAKNNFAKLEQNKNDLKLAKQSVKFYEGLIQEAEHCANRYLEKWHETEEKLAAIEEADKKTKRLEAENYDLRRSNAKLTEEMNGMKDLHSRLRNKDFALLEENEKKRLATEKRLKEIEKQLDESCKDNSAVEEQLQVVVTSLDAAVIETAKDLNLAKARVRTAERLQSATFSEIQPLRRFYARANLILQNYADVFKQLLNITDQNIMHSADFIKKLKVSLDACEADCEAFHTLRDTLKYEGMDPDEHYLHDQLTEMGQSAEKIQESLKIIAQDVIPFLCALERRPDILELIRLKFRWVR